MTEPKGVADRAEEVVPGVWRWTIPRDERIGGYETDAHAAAADGGIVLIDPLPLRDEALERLGNVEAICLTAQCHQRSSWRYRRRFDAPVYAPAGVRPMEEEPDELYEEGDVLPGGLRTIRTPGPEEIHFGFLREREPRVLFCPDLLTNYPGEGLDFVPLKYHDDPPKTRESVERLLDLDFAVLCFNHGAPIVDDPHGAIRGLLARTA
jgi:hypothetical protein